ncbi:MAG: SPOR domain-containing protein [Gemmatimonadetes bacterium]|nr:SPOR domain-containing protein [Gemmatimonadota bacterium]MBT6904078.1 SPOR domain-containing protein [Gemmatimonadota bacterium]MBT7419760.1 SPOR domain-containing protein [Gemmatimonadota bacterium]
MKRSPLLLLVLLGAVSCAGPSNTPNLLAGPVDAAQSVRETFDVRSLGEDLLLIQPVFQRASLHEPIVEFTSEPTVEFTSEPTVNPTSEIDADLPVEYGPVNVFRLQLVTLSNGAVARRRQAELEQMLGTTVHLITRDEHFLLQAGQYETRQEAQKLKSRVAALGPDYADAYVISATIETPLSNPSATAVETPRPAEAEKTTEMVRTFGWRVLIDQFLSHDEANRLKGRAIKRLRRPDIDVTFKAPWYKVEVGHYRTDPQAQAATEKIEAYYPNALKVRSQILVPRED